MCVCANDVDDVDDDGMATRFDCAPTLRALTAKGKGGSKCSLTILLDDTIFA